MPAHYLSRLILSAIAGGQGVAPLGIDLNRTHATHPLWPGHARFHVVWQSFTSFFLVIPEAALLWWPGSHQAARFSLAAALIATSLCGFIVAAAVRRAYGGTFHDPHGIQPLRIPTGQRIIKVDGNAMAVAAAVLALTASLLLFLVFDL
jgi:hypothetical protein